jgi:hypothetical protein
MTQATKTSRTTRASATRTKRSFEAPSKLEAPQAPDGSDYYMMVRF